MTTQEPYEFKSIGNNSYSFKTDNDVLYNVEFTDGSFYFARFPDYLSIFEFSINVLKTGKYLSPPHDKRVELTVVFILSTFLSSKDNSIIYVCQNIDDREYARKRKFDLWFSKNQNNSLEKHDLTIEYEDIAYLTSLIIHKNNTNKDEIVNLFFDQLNQYNK
jgi:Family of unknown function (DUF6169)